MIEPIDLPNVVELAAERARTRLFERCSALGLAAVSPAAGIATPSEAATALLSAEARARCERALSGGSIGCDDGLGVLRLELSHRSRPAEIIDILAFASVGDTMPGHDPLAWPGITPRPVEELRLLAAPLAWCLGDALSESEAILDTNDLAEQLGDSYETLDLLYSLGRSMGDIQHPDRFITRTCSRLRTTLDFGYVAVHIPTEADVGDLITGRTIWDGTPGDTESLQTLDRIAQIVASAEDSSGLFLGPQALVRPLINDRGFVGMVLAGDKRSEGGYISSYDTKLVDAACGFIATYLTNSRMFAEQRRVIMGVLEALSAAIDAKDPYTRGHSQRVAYLAQQTALALGLDEATAERLRVCGLLHDVGKIGVPEAVLRKSGKLTDAEFDEIKKHPEIGHRILKDLTGLDDVLPAVLYHHERIDGRGYPHGLSGDAIPLFARIVAAADTFDAMSSTRSYRAKMPREAVLAEIRRCAGAQLDAVVAEALLSVDLGGFDALIQQHAALSSFAGSRAA
jgi:putative nucleotidyltransferase with HDIG domain